jgi:hypothetical protein
MVRVIVKFMDALYPGWRDYFIVSASTDGARSMTGRIQGLATRIGACTPGKLIPIWCGLHQLDIVMQRVFMEALNEDFYSTLTGFDRSPTATANLNFQYAIDVPQSGRYEVDFDGHLLFMVDKQYCCCSTAFVAKVPSCAPPI